MGIKPIKKVNVSEQVYEQLKDLLLQGEWKPGEKLPSENELAEKFGVSRVTIRQALQKLGVLGVVETRLGEGSFVREADPGAGLDALLPTMLLSQDRLMAVEEFREIIEVESARLAAERAEDDDVQELRETLQRMKDSAGNPADFGAADLDFHMKLGRMTRNPLVIKTQDILRSTLLEAREDIVERTGYEPGIRFHGQILEAVERHDGVLARRLMHEHLSFNKNFYRKKEEL